jgi:hypothetical protein
MTFLALACLILASFIHYAYSFDAFESGEVAGPMLEFYKSLSNWTRIHPNHKQSGREYQRISETNEGFSK